MTATKTTKTKTAKRAPKGEAKVRDYLAFIEDPTTAVNETAVNRALKAFQKASDPLEKITLRQAWIDAKTPDGSKLEADFISVAKEWAEVRGVDADTFLAQGVSRDVLRAAGFEVRAGKYKPRVSGQVVADLVLSTTGEFTVSDIVEATSASPAGVRNVINALIEEGKVEVLPHVPTGESGKPAVRYQTV